MRYLVVSLCVLAIFITVGATAELLSNLAPALLPEAVKLGLRQGGYSLLHEEPVVKHWVRASNVLNFLNGMALLTAVVGLLRRRLWGWQLARLCLAIIIAVGVVGGGVLVIYVFPKLDLVGTLPVPASTMKAAMFLGPAVIVAVAAAKLFALHRPRVRAQFAPKGDAELA